MSQHLPRHAKPTSAPPIMEKAAGYSNELAVFARENPKRVGTGTVLTVLLVLVGTIFGASQIERPPQEELDEVVAKEIVPEPVMHIEPAPAVEMMIPALDMYAVFEDEACRVKDGAIDPATMEYACTYTADDRPYSLPGTDADDIVVIAGHTGAGVAGVFDELYDGSNDEHKVSMGDKLYLRTATSGDQWLVYEATDMHSPQKELLAGDPNIWGESATPGRLLTISCVQPLFQTSIRNAVVGWQYEGVTNNAPQPAMEDPAPKHPVDTGF
ncbi:hypothetical protein [Corynebacterium pseudodiphtheriticum]|uniref:hypothetical protein n=1 Tax=Corynebacterium pseudodiphtheriticum TaxID=37637 RepID=UPI00254E0DEB|nr:hypothetical protein [Corynebacterium pseudodiphtheriticum]MDK8546344.1 hypothetical protein [Corynebacterium pseudodiphtheriticum]MDK8686461.1 hypothetical protein [Corynebacterium pseudodiphtheriticum]